MSKKIEFIPLDIFTSETETGPVPSVTKIPDWFKQIPSQKQFSDEEYVYGKASPWTKFKNKIGRADV